MWCCSLHRTEMQRKIRALLYHSSRSSCTFKVMKVFVVYLVIPTKCFINMKVQEIESWNFLISKHLKRCAWRPNFSHFGYEITKISTVPVQHRCPTFSIGHSISKVTFFFQLTNFRQQATILGTILGRGQLGQNEHFRRWLHHVFKKKTKLNVCLQGKVNDLQWYWLYLREYCVNWWVVLAAISTGKNWDILENVKFSIKSAHFINS